MSEVGGEGQPSGTGESSPPATPSVQSAPESPSMKRLQYWIRRAHDAEWRIEVAKEEAVSTARWAQETWHEYLRLSERCTYLYGVAASLGATQDLLAGGLMVTLPELTGREQIQLKAEIVRTVDEFVRTNMDEAYRLRRS